MKKTILILGLVGVLCGGLAFLLAAGGNNPKGAFLGLIILLGCALGLIIRKVFNR